MELSIPGALVSGFVATLVMTMMMRLAGSGLPLIMEPVTSSIGGIRVIPAAGEQR